MRTTFAFAPVTLFAAAVALDIPVQTSAAASAIAAQDSTAIRPFTVTAASQAALDDLRKRIVATRWPEKETVSDDSQGVQLATLQKLASDGVMIYDWRVCVQNLRRLPQFIAS